MDLQYPAFAFSKNIPAEHRRIIHERLTSLSPSVCAATATLLTAALESTQSSLDAANEVNQQYPPEDYAEAIVQVILCLGVLDRYVSLPLFSDRAGVQLARNEAFPRAQKEEWVKSGRSLLASKHAKDNDQAFTEWLASEEYVRGVVASGLPLYSMSGWRVLHHLGLLKWARSAYSTVTVGHTYAAALIATQVTPSVLPLVRLPWDAFVLEVPNGLLPLTRIPRMGTDALMTSEIRRILVTRLDPTTGPEPSGPRVGFIAHAEAGGNLWRFGEMRDLATEEGADLPDVTGMDTADERLAAALGRLVVNACLAMSSPENLTRLSGSSPKGNKKGNKRGSPEPVHLHYKLGAPVTIDLRKEVREYLLGQRRSSPTVQTLVSGHWKLQHHGPQRSLAKTLWIQPYWRGPEDAPILVRPHHLGVST